MFDTKSLTAENTFAGPVLIRGEFNVSITGTWVGTITLQRSLDGGTVWGDVASWTTNFEGWDNQPDWERAWRVGDQPRFRLGFKTGEFTSGTAVCRLGQG